SAGGWLRVRFRNASTSGCHGLVASVLDSRIGNGEMPACDRNASSEALAGPLAATLVGACSGRGPVVGRGDGFVPATAAGASFSVPNSSNSIIFCVHSWAPKRGLGRPFVG